MLLFYLLVAANMLCLLSYNNEKAASLKIFVRLSLNKNKINWQSGLDLLECCALCSWIQRCDWWDSGHVTFDVVSETQQTVYFNSLLSRRMSVNQCSVFGSGSRSVCFYPNGSSGSVIYLYGSGSGRILSSTSKKMKKNLDFYCFATSLWLFIFEEWCKCTVSSKRNKRLVGVTDEKSSIWIWIRIRMSQYGSKYVLELPYPPYPQGEVQLELSMRGMIITLHCCKVLTIWRETYFKNKK